ncbi:D-glycero-beta-D-manno-heptose 1,7-bisphosphate 7-phosphatase [Thalassotalea sp. Y01]|uniref:D-glycero-beta-D-manno-heptose 1,7-bisphosphate 7-phosphatase n=1 Tax=Thalassotalea sp. Y01 TaxID=2729613 RepID=UPI00145EC12A|nr:D-glycero-beta-D-manno-heptose 1,7-bisphosphate 7-phosphatase [Thalassotalea sp. Y01]NMP17745.1 D-glycero-beta-D-manno-heptose 1,7-bisphosphate 7-phosphatase [Thalassotalea sp. Y01]
MNKALFLDRDGIINVDHGYVYKAADFEFVDGIFTLCQKANEKGYDIFVITNQSGIARGLYSEQDFFELSRWMSERFAEHDVIIKDVYFCPHHPVKGNAPYKKQCQCRKPEPGMILKAAQQHNIDLQNSIFIGDKTSDMVAAQRAGIESRVLVSSRYHQDDDIDAIKVANLCAFIERF